jgi:hypothetical protein
LAQLRTAIRQAEDHYRAIAPGAADEAAMAADLIFLELNGLGELEEAEDRTAEIDLTEPDQETAEAAVAAEVADGGADSAGPDVSGGDAALVDGPREPDFYRRRLAGLRERLEQATTPD